MIGSHGNLEGGAGCMNMARGYMYTWIQIYLVEDNHPVLIEVCGVERQPMNVKTRAQAKRLTACQHDCTPGPFDKTYNCRPIKLGQTIIINSSHAQFKTKARRRSSQRNEHSFLRSARQITSPDSHVTHTLML